MSKIRIIKTLPHLTSLFIKNEATTVYSNSYSESILKTINSFETLDKAEIKFSKILNWLASFSMQNKSEVLDEFRAGERIEYKRVETIENKLEFSVKGDSITIWALGYSNPIRLEFFGEDCEKITLIDNFTGRKVEELDKLLVSKLLPAEAGELPEIIISEPNTHNSFQKIIFTNKNVSGIDKFFRDIDLEIVDTDFVFPNLYFSNLEIFQKELDRLESLDYKIAINTKHKELLQDKFGKYLNNIDDLRFTIGDLIEDRQSTIDNLKSLPAGFISKDLKVAFFTDRELFGSIFLNRSEDKQLAESTLKKLLRKFEGEINIGEFVVHEDYGIGEYAGLSQEVVEGVTNEYLLLKFAENDELYVPINQIAKVTKYLGNDGLPPKLTSLGKGHWQILKNKVKASTLITAKELIEHFAKRELSKAMQIKKEDSDDYQKFVDNFPFSETSDQIKATNEIIHDLEQEKPMNRVLIGDVGFGKTEVIMRAAFKVVEAGGQVAILAPTTILTAQHYVVFKDRFKDFDIKIGFLSRFNTSAENKKIVEQVNKGEIDIIIGTHRLFGDDLKFKKLGLLVADEEQKFGVKQKEKIKKINYGVHVLSVSATPIPRTLSLALSTIQEISIISTPPVGRKAVQTELIFNDFEKAVKAIEMEIKRGGQVYFVHNEVQTIAAIKLKLENLLPGIKFATGHGQMSAHELDLVMSDFYHHNFDCLICTSIIENGLDVKNANTVIIHNAHKFGLSQLYQIRGRVGRSEKKAFCYLMCPKPDQKKLKDQKEDITNLSDSELIRYLSAKKSQENKNKLYIDRLQSLVDHQELGSGFNIASKDLEIRGAGNILGEKQHGHISAVGYSLYIEMLADAVEKLKNS